jgi:hypothetical protein
MRHLFIILFACTYLVPSTLLSKDTSLRLVPEEPKVPKVHRNSNPPTKNSKDLGPGIEYISIDCNVSPGMLSNLKRFKPLWWGVNETQGLLTLHLNKGSGNWVMMATFPNNKNCIVSTGMQQEIISEKAGKPGIVH